MSSSPPSSREIVWGYSADPGDVYEPSDGLKLSGYTGTPAPAYEIVNWLLNRVFGWVAYLRSRGIPDYDSTETYSTGDFAQYSGRLYQRIGGSSSQGVAPTDTNYWAIRDCQSADISSLTTLTGTGLTLEAALLVRHGASAKLSFCVTGTLPDASGQIVIDSSLWSLLPEDFLTWSLQSSAGNDGNYANFTRIAHGWEFTVGGVGGLGDDWELTIEATKA